MRMTTDLSLLVLLALVSGACTASEAAAPDGGLSTLDGGWPGSPCRTHGDCRSDLACEYWEQGCDRQGECRVTPAMRGPDGGFVGFPLDASLSRFGICSCDGRWLGNVYTDFPFQRRDFDGDEPCTAIGADAAPQACVPRLAPDCDNAGCAGFVCDAGR